MNKKIRQIIIISVISFLFFSGCVETEKINDGAGQSDSSIRSPEGMKRYLEGRHLPALQSVQVWNSSYGEGLELTTANYQIFTTLLDPLMLSQIPAFMESACRAYNSQLPSPIETKNRFVIYLFADRRQWEDFTTAFAGSDAPVYLKIKAGAYCLKGDCVAYNIGREATFSILGHEAWHQFNSRHFRFRLPSWLDEGIAMLFETNRYERGFFYFQADKNLYRLGGLKKTLANHKIIPLRQLLMINPGQVLSVDNSEAVTAFYSQSYALVRFLREDSYGKRLLSYQKMLLDGLNGSWPLDPAIKNISANRNIPLTVQWNQIVGPQLFRQYIDSDIEKAEKEYYAFCQKITYHVHFKE